MSTANKPTYSLQEAIETLFTYRARNVRASQDVVEKGLFILHNGGSDAKLMKKMGDEYWSFLEQLAFASLDLGNFEVADDCISQLEYRFPDSPRVTVLHGMRKESAATTRAELLDVLDVYDKLLSADDGNAGVWKRRIATYKQLNDTQKAIEDLCAYLDTFYTDVEGWLELADLYAGCQRYTSSLQALSHAMVLSPQNPFYVLQFAETSVTNGEAAIGLKMYLRCLEMVEGDAVPGTGKSETGIERRAWFGVKSCTKRLLAGGGGDAGHPKGDELRGLDEIATERLAQSYATNKDVLEWVRG